MIEVEDMRRLLREMAALDEDEEEWCESVGMELETMGWMFENLLTGFARAFQEDHFPDKQVALNSLVGCAFRIGWETCKQYGAKT